VRLHRRIRGLRTGAGALAAMACIVLALAAGAEARPADKFGPQPAAPPAAEAPTAVQEPAVAPDNGTDAIVFVLIGLGAGVAVLGAGYLGARRATRATQPQPTDVRIS
jgi:hypothetical protein